MEEKREHLEAQLSAYLDDELTPQERAEIAAWLERDAEARQMLADLETMRGGLRSLPRARASGEMAETIRARLERQALLGEPPSTAGRMPADSSLRGRWAAAAAIVLMTGVAGYVTWLWNTPDPATMEAQQYALLDRENRTPDTREPQTIQEPAPDADKTLLAARSADEKTNGPTADGETAKALVHRDTTAEPATESPATPTSIQSAGKLARGGPEAQVSADDIIANEATPIADAEPSPEYAFARTDGDIAAAPALSPADSQADRVTVVEVALNEPSDRRRVIRQLAAEGSLVTPRAMKFGRDGIEPGQDTPWQRGVAGTGASGDAAPASSYALTLGTEPQAPPTQVDEVEVLVPDEQARDRLVAELEDEPTGARLYSDLSDESAGAGATLEERELMLDGTGGDAVTDDLAMAFDTSADVTAGTDRAAAQTNLRGGVAGASTETAPTRAPAETAPVARSRVAKQETRQAGKLPRMLEKERSLFSVSRPDSRSPARADVTAPDKDATDGAGLRPNRAVASLPSAKAGDQAVEEKAMALDIKAETAAPLDIKAETAAPQPGRVLRVKIRVQPLATQSATAKPASTQPASTQPASAQPASAQPASTQPASTQPASAQPASAQPASTQPAPIQPVKRTGETQPAAEEQSSPF